GLLIGYLWKGRKHLTPASNLRERRVFFPPLAKGGAGGGDPGTISDRVSRRGAPGTIHDTVAHVLALAWLVPLASLLAAAVPLDHAASRHPLVQGLINRCRFAAVPADDVERLALW